MFWVDQFLSAGHGLIRKKTTDFDEILWQSSKEGQIFVAIKTLVLQIMDNYCRIFYN